jgi:hypothetical protein
MGRDNNNAIENATYRITNASGVVLDWTRMTPAGNKWGPSRTNNVRAGIATSSLSPGNYTVEVKVMAGGPRTNSGRYSTDNGEWSAINGIGLEVTS